MKLPKTVYVVYRKEDKSDWLEADQDINSFENGDKVGVYIPKGNKNETHIPCAG